jgi:hypothetical protein
MWQTEKYDVVHMLRLTLLCAHVAHAVLTNAHPRLKLKRQLLTPKHQNGTNKKEKLSLTSVVFLPLESPPMGQSIAM